MTSTTSSSSLTMSKTHSLSSSNLKPSNQSSKKAPKEPKNDKSLETTVEKLTQNRNKEISGKKEMSKLDKAERDKLKRLGGQQEVPAKDGDVPTGKTEENSRLSGRAAVGESESAAKRAREGRNSEELKCSEDSEKGRRNVSTDRGEGARRSHEGEAAAAASPARSKDLSNNVENARKDGGGVVAVEGGK